MTTEQELRGLITKHEADRVELTVSPKDTDKFAEAVCAFANDLPNHRQAGYLIIGVTDSGEFAAIDVTDELLRNLAGLRADGNIQPLPALTVEKVVVAEGAVAVVTVQPAMLPPVRYKGRICIRSGPRRGYATEHEERILIERRVSHAKTFDAQPCLGSRVSDVSDALFLIDYRQQAVAADVIAENHRSVEHQLASLRFYDLGHACPTNAGILLFGLDVCRWLPGAFVLFLRVAGISLAEPIATEREIAGDLLTVLRQLDALVDAQLTRFPVADSTLRERTVEAYPRVAVRELLMNAVMHRSYESTAPLRITWLDDRLEIQSPGGLYGEASPENFPKQTSYRNPVVAEAMKNLGYVNRYGRGVIRAQETLAKNGSPPAEFVFDHGYVLATIRRRP
jgi:ATP-dependent DNA helicase RecG